jgi:hypothetical protein
MKKQRKREENGLRADLILLGSSGFKMTILGLISRISQICVLHLSSDFSMLRTARPLTCLQSATQHVYRQATLNPIKTSGKWRRYIFDCRSTTTKLFGSQTNSLSIVMTKTYTTIGAQRHLISKSTRFSWTASSKIVGFVSAATGTMSAGLWTKQPLKCQGK